MKFVKVDVCLSVIKLVMLIYTVIDPCLEQHGPPAHSGHKSKVDHHTLSKVKRASFVRNCKNEQHITWRVVH